MRLDRVLFVFIDRFGELCSPFFMLLNIVVSDTICLVCL